MNKWQGLFRRQVTLLVGLLVVASLGLDTRAANKGDVEERLRQDVKYLASDECEGRGIYTKGIEKAAAYIADQFKKAGLKPGGVNSTYYQPFPVSSGPSKVEKGTKLILRGPTGQTIELGELKDFLATANTASGNITAPVVFAGYGITAPDIKYDDYKDLDVEGKVVIVLRKTPRWGNKFAPFGGPHGEKYGDLKAKFATAEINKAAAVVLVNDGTEKVDKLDPLADLSRGYSISSIPTLYLKRQVLDQMLLSSLGQSLASIEKAIDRDLQPRSTALDGWKATVEVKVTRKAVDVKNVVAVVPGSGPLAKEIVVIGAHYDHLGYGEAGSKAAKSEDKKKIHYGADDNASGTTAMMELARRFAGSKNWQGRTLVFMAFSAEEKGLLGSRFYCDQQPLFPLADTVAMINLDMVGRMTNHEESGKGKLIVEGVGTAKKFESMIEKFNKKYDFHLTKREGGGPYSDHYSFYQKKVPVVFLWTGTHKDYHLPSDTWEKINYGDMARIVDLAEDIIAHVGTESKRPEYVYVAPVITVGVGGGPRLGIMPGNYEGMTGIPIGAVSPQGPAAKAGLKEGDMIISINDQPVKNITAYMAVMRQQKVGQPINVTVQRGKEKITVKVTPQ